MPTNTATAEKASQRAAKWNAEHPERFRETQQRYRTAHAKEIRAKERKRAKRTRGARLANLRKWRAANPWYAAWYYAKQVCTDSGHPGYPRYGGAGIGFSLTREEAATIWERGGAGRMDRPMLGRRDTAGNFSFANSLFLEMRDNPMSGLNIARKRAAELRLAAPVGDVDRARPERWPFVAE